MSATDSDNQVGQYVLGKELGRGSFATVFLAQHEKTQEIKAVKKIDRSRLSAKLLQNLESEISILRDFQHENIVKLYGIMKNSSHIFLFLEFCGGGDLHKYIRLKGRLSEPVAQHFMRHLAQGLIFLWQKQLIHRDIKPQNLLLSSQSDHATLKIADFGFARHLATAALADTLCGSPLYMAPEILMFQKYDGKADLWSAGTVLFEMLAGRPPYGGANQSELVANIRTKEIRLPAGVQISPPCVALIQMLLQRKPAKRASFERFLTAEFLQPLSNFENDHSSSTSSSSSNSYSSAINEEQHPSSAPAHPSSVVSMAQAAADAVANSVSDPWNPSRDSVGSQLKRRNSTPSSLPSSQSSSLNNTSSSTSDSVENTWQSSRRASLPSFDSPNSGGAMIKSPYQTDNSPNWPGCQGNGLHSAHASFDPHSQYHSGYQTGSSVKGQSPNQQQLQQHQQQQSYLRMPGPIAPFDSRQQKVSPFMQPLAASPPDGFSFARYAQQPQQSQSSSSSHHRSIEFSPPSQPMTTVAEGEDSDEWLVVDSADGSGSGSWAAKTPVEANKMKFDFQSQATLLSPRGRQKNTSSSEVNDGQETTQEEENIPEFLSRLGGMVGNMELLGRCAMAVARVGDGAAALVLSSQQIPSSFPSSNHNGHLAALIEDTSGDSDNSTGPPSPISPPSALSPGSSFPLNKSHHRQQQQSPPSPKFLNGGPPVHPFPPNSGAGNTGSSSSSSSSSSMRSSLETDDHLSDALLLYMKGMGLVKRAVELGRSILEQIHAMRPLKSTEPDIASLANNARVLSGRTNELLSWLSAQYALLLDRAEKCREQRISLTSSSQSSGNNSGNGTNNISPSGGGGGGGGGGSMNASDGGRGGLAGRVQLRIYGAALQLARAAAVKEVLGNHALSLRMYRHGQLLIESLLLEPNITPNDHSILTGYDHGFQDRIAHLKKVISDPDTFDHDDILGNVKLPETSDSNDVSNENPETNSDENTSESAGLDIPSLKGLPRIISDDKALSSLQIAPPMKMLQPRSLRDHAGPASPPRLTRPSDNPFGLDLGAEDEGAAFA